MPAVRAARGGALHRAASRGARRHPGKVGTAAARERARAPEGQFISAIRYALCAMR